LSHSLSLLSSATSLLADEHKQVHTKMVAALAARDAAMQAAAEHHTCALAASEMTCQHLQKELEELREITRAGEFAQQELREELETTRERGKQAEEALKTCLEQKKQACRGELVARASEGGAREALCAAEAAMEDLERRQQCLLEEHEESQVRHRREADGLRALVEGLRETLQRMTQERSEAAREKSETEQEVVGGLRAELRRAHASHLEVVGELACARMWEKKRGDETARLRASAQELGRALSAQVAVCGRELTESAEEASSGWGVGVRSGLGREEGPG